MENNKLFKQTEKWWQNTILDDSWVTQGLYFYGYKQAGDILTEKILEERLGIDALFLPISFCYRHFIELALKEAILEAYFCLRDLFLINDDEYARLKDKLNNTHNLKYLWEILIEYLDKLEKNRIKKEERKIQIFIFELHGIDMKGEAFRYFTDKKDNPHFLKDIRADLNELKSKINEIYIFFIGLIDYLSDYRKCLPKEDF